MNGLLSPFRQLMERKLWPVALLLVGALVAVPVVLSKDASSPAPAPSAVASAAVASQSPTQPIVSLGEPADRESRRKVLGARKNPFKPVKVAKEKVTTGTSAVVRVAPKQTPSTTGSAPPSGGSAPAVGGNPFAPAVQPEAPKRVYELYSLKIRFGSTDSDRMARRSIKRLTALPKMAEPTLVYLGLKRDLRTAVFLVDANTRVVGDGRCRPRPSDCQTLELRKGQTAFVDVLDDQGQTLSQYQLDLVSIVRRQTGDAVAARAARQAVARGGRDALRSKVSRVNGLKYDHRKGVLIEGR